MLHHASGLLVAFHAQPGRNVFLITAKHLKCDDMTTNVLVLDYVDFWMMKIWWKH